MKWNNLYGAVVAMLGMVATVEAGPIMLTSHSCGGAEKSCGCASRLISPNLAGLCHLQAVLPQDPYKVSTSVRAPSPCAATPVAATPAKAVLPSVHRLRQVVQLRPRVPLPRLSRALRLR